MPWLPGGQRPWPPSYGKAQLEGPQKCGQPRTFPDSSEDGQPHRKTVRQAVSRRPPKKPEATNYYFSRQRPPDTSGDLQRPTQPMHTPVIRPTKPAATTTATIFSAPGNAPATSERPGPRVFRSDISDSACSLP